MSEKLCVFCKHWHFYGGDQGFSELTPGSDASMDCSKHHWDRPGRGPYKGFVIFNLHDERAFREMIQKAITCPDYEQVQP